MNLPVFQSVTNGSFEEFISFWSELYFYPEGHLYKKNILKKSYTQEDIQELYLWKNGMKLSSLKQTSLDRKIKSKVREINSLKKNSEIDIDAFREDFRDLTAVWKIFLLHIISPHEFPIYDQNVHRTYLFINGQDYRNFSFTSLSNSKKEKFYFNEYLTFIKKTGFQSIKQMDEAFFAFGQFLNTKNYSYLLQKF